MDSHLIERIVQKTKEIDPSLSGDFLTDLKGALRNTEELATYLDNRRQESEDEFEKALKSIAKTENNV